VGAAVAIVDDEISSDGPADSASFVLVRAVGGNDSEIGYFFVGRVVWLPLIFGFPRRPLARRPTSSALRPLVLLRRAGSWQGLLYPGGWF
jgi:hypothetical protein